MDKTTLSSLVKTKRIAKGFTQQELADLSKMSLRSVQRIEKGDVMPRLYTVKMLDSVLDLNAEDQNNFGVEPSYGYVDNKQKVILTIIAPVFIVLISLAFVAQSAGFPETHFEFLMMIMASIAVYSVFLLRIWR